MKTIYLHTVFLIILLMAGSVYTSNGDIIKSDIMFDHQLHTDLECTDCHQQATGSTNSDDNLFPEMDYCGECHEIEEDDECGTCHRNTDDPVGLPNPIRDILFSHKKHTDQKIDCSGCHDFSTAIKIPGKPKCMECHDGRTAKNDCKVCHDNKYSLLDIHPLNWRDQHGSRVLLDEEFCFSCHKNESFCIDCHQGDNTDGAIHDLNYRFTHGLDAGGRETNCYNCHDNQLFCNDCHLSENRMPLKHSTLNWINEHGSAARNSIENCASCHDSSDPNCARVGCHSDTDGLRGTDLPIHSDIYGGEGPWHYDDGYFCFQCHTNTRTAGLGFCGYCHGFED